MTWTCVGSFTREYRSKVKRIKNDIVYYDGSEDGRPYRVQKPTWLTGTTLWTKKNDNGFQWMDEEDFRGFTKLQAGLPFQKRCAYTAGRREVGLELPPDRGSTKAYKHPVLGNVELGAAIGEASCLSRRLLVEHDLLCRTGLGHHGELGVGRPPWQGGV